jgi:NodT family efflux transporter outer membrane factor (OMF) lipoprotein
MSITRMVRGVRRMLAPVVAGALLHGCVLVGPDFVTPEAPQMSRWVRHELAAHQQYSGITDRRGPEVEWWRVFNDPTLDKLIALARQQNLTLRIAGIRIYQARAQLGVIIGDQFPQSQTAGFEYKKERITKNTGLAREVEKVAPNFDPTFHDWQIGFDAGWELDIWGKVRRGVEAAMANLAAQVANYDDVLVTLCGDVATAYVTMRALQAGVALVNQNVAIQTESLNITELRFKNGVTTELDVQQASALLNNTKASVPPLQTDLAKARNALAVLLGIPPGEVGKLVDRPGAIPRPPATVGLGIPADLLRRRPDIRAAELNAAAQAARIGVARADLYPSFAISGAIGLKATNLDNLFQDQSFTGFINPGISWNILNYGRIRNNVRVQDAKYQELIANYQRVVLNAYAEVEDALAGFMNAKQEAIFLARAVTAARAASRIAMDQYRDGTADYSRVLNTQQELLRAEERLTSVRADVVTNLIAVYKSLGGGWQPANQGDFIPQATKQQMASRTKWGKLLEPQAIPQGARDLAVPAPQLRPVISPELW